MAKLSDFKAGDILLTYGSDMGCHKCVCITKVLSVSEDGIVTESDGCRMIARWKDMQYFDGYFPYSEGQRKAMQTQCDKEYNEWLEACRKERERAEKYHIERTERMRKLVTEKGYSDGTHTIFDLSDGYCFFRWKKYDILHINDQLQVFGIADDGDTMFLSVDDLPVPTIRKIMDELEKRAA